MDIHGIPLLIQENHADPEHIRRSWALALDLHLAALVVYVVKHALIEFSPMGIRRRSMSIKDVPKRHLSQPIFYARSWQNGRRAEGSIATTTPPAGEGAKQGNVRRNVWKIREPPRAGDRAQPASWT